MNVFGQRIGLGNQGMMRPPHVGSPQMQRMGMIHPGMMPHLGALPHAPGMVHPGQMMMQHPAALNFLRQRLGGMLGRI